jgi:hypothetical protein
VRQPGRQKREAWCMFRARNVEVLKCQRGGKRRPAISTAAATSLGVVPAGLADGRRYCFHNASAPPNGDLPDAAERAPSQAAGLKMRLRCTAAGAILSWSSTRRPRRRWESPFPPRCCRVLTWSNSRRRDGRARPTIAERFDGLAPNSFRSRRMTTTKGVGHKPMSRP